jgi:hypothetical protein
MSLESRSQATARARRGLFVLLAATALVLPFTSSTAAATPPPNDDFDNATVISSLPFSDEIDTSGATTAQDDPDCTGQGPTVWYSFTPAAEMWIDVNTFGSSYPTTLSLYFGSRGSLWQHSCTASGEPHLQFPVSAGTTYYFMVGSLWSEPGGKLVFPSRSSTLCRPRSLWR